MIRHFTRLSTWNAAIDLGLYPLGSCTMKYNPKINEKIARLPGFSARAPDAARGPAAGLPRSSPAELERQLAEISGMDRVTLQPAAGAQGELAGHHDDPRLPRAARRQRRKVLIPDTAHGTNPASAALNGYQVIPVPSGEDGVLHPEELAKRMTPEVAALMITNPNTLGLFEEHIARIAEIVHARGGLIYGDGANLNALLGIARPGDLGIDVMHFNLHKTFSTPHGGGGPGAGPVGVKNALAPFLPLPVVRKLRRAGGRGLRARLRLPALDRPAARELRQRRDAGARLRLHPLARPRRAAALRGDGGAERQLPAGAAARRLPRPLRPPGACTSACSRTASSTSTGVTTLDVAKRLIDYGFHPPTVYFPLIVHGALMIEPTESESLEGLDRFVEAMLAIAEEAREDPELVRTAPHHTRRSRLDETRAARQPVLRWQPEDRQLAPQSAPLPGRARGLRAGRRHALQPDPRPDQRERR